eukprot:2839855-Pleurochrysis_carterae.AAC.1
MRLCSVSPRAPAASAALKWAARKARLRLLVPAGGFNCRIRLSVCARAPPGISGATSQPASRERNSFTEDM